MQIKDVEKLKQWLLKKLEPLCDADPAALAKYVVALLRKEKPKAALKELCIDQLEVFLAKETTNFVDQLFRGLESECYLKGEDAGTPPSSPPTGGALKPNPRSPCPSVTPSPPRDHVPRIVVDRRPSEDIRSKEVDDEDRDFRRSRKTSGGGGGGGGGGGARENEGDPARKEGPLRGGDAKGKRNLRKTEPEGPTTTSSSSSGSTLAPGGGRLHSRRGDPEPSGGSGTTGPQGGGGRRLMRDRLGPRPDDRSDSRGYRSWRDRRSRSRSRSPPRRDHRSRSRSPRVGPDSTAEERGRKRPHRAENTAEGGPAAKRRERCKNYDERGFCMLGEKCPFYHGIDPMVFGSGLPVPSYPPPPLPLGLPPPLPLGLPPLPIALALGKQGLPSSLPPPVPPAPPTLTGRVSPSSSTDGYNPEDPGLTATTAPSSSSSSSVPSSSSAPSAFIPTPILPPTLPMRPAFPPQLPGIGVPPPPLPPFPPRPPFSHTLTSTFSTYPRLFPGPRPPMRVPPSDTLLIRKIPRDLNSVARLSAHFEKFGTIVNLTVRYEGDPESALVQFSSLADAKRAHGSTEAVLNNRFVRIYYLRKDMGPDLAPFGPYGRDSMVGVEFQTPERMAVAVINETPGKAVNSTDAQHASDHTHYERTVQGRTEQKTQALPPSASSLPTPTPTPTPVPAPPPPTLAKPPVSQAHSFISAVPSHQHHPQQRQQHQQPRQAQANPEVAKKTLELQKMKQALLQKQIEQQKGLLAKLEKSVSTEEKSHIMKALKVLSISITKTKDATAKATTPATKATTSTTKATTSTTKAATLTQPLTPTSPKQGIVGGASTVVGGALSTTTHLKEKAEALRKQAHQLGLISSPSQPLPSATAGRGRGQPQFPPTLTIGRGRGQQQQLHPQPGAGRGRGQPDLRSKLDHKPRQLLVINVEDKEKLTQYFDSFGGLVQVEVDPVNPHNLIYTFRNSFTAHKVVKSGSTLNGKPLIMKWYVTKAAPRIVSPPPPTVPPSTLTSSAFSNIQLQALEPNYEEVPPVTTPTLSKPDPAALHLVDDDEDDEESEGRSWRR